MIYKILFQDHQLMHGKEANWILIPGSKTVVLPETDEQTGDIIIKLKRQSMSGEMVELGTMLERVDKDTFKYIVTTLDSELDRPREKGGSNPHTLSQLREIAKREIEKLAMEKYKNLAGLAQQYLFYWKRETA